MVPWRDWPCKTIKGLSDRETARRENPAVRPAGNTAYLARVAGRSGSAFESPNRYKYLFLRNSGRNLSTLFLKLP